MLYTDTDHSQLLRPTCQGSGKVSPLLQSARKKFPIRLISKEHSWHEGICKGLCSSLWQIFPPSSAWANSSPFGRSLPGSVLRKQPAREPKCSPASPAPATQPIGSLVRSSQNSRNTVTYPITPLSQSLLENSDFLCKGQTQQLIHFQWLKHLLPQGPEQVSNGQGSEGLDTPWYRPGLPPEMISTHSPPPSIRSSPAMSRLQLCPSVTLPNLFLILLLIPPLLANSSSAVLPGLMTLKGRFILPRVLLFLIVDGTWVRWSCCLQADVLCNLSVSFLKTLAYFTLVSFPSHLIEKASKTKTRTSYAVNFKVDTRGSLWSFCSFTAHASESHD